MGYTISGKRITLTRGDTLECDVDVRNPDGTAYEMQEGDSLRFMLAKEAGGETICTKEITGGSFRLEHADTAGLDFGTYFFDVEMDFAGGDVDTIIERGTLVLTEEADPKSS